MNLHLPQEQIFPLSLQSILVLFLLILPYPLNFINDIRIFCAKVAIKFQSSKSLTIFLTEKDLLTYVPKDISIDSYL